MRFSPASSFIQSIKFWNRSTAPATFPAAYPFPQPAPPPAHRHDPHPHDLPHMRRDRQWVGPLNAAPKSASAWGGRGEGGGRRATSPRHSQALTSISLAPHASRQRPPAPCITPRSLPTLTAAICEVLVNVSSQLLCLTNVCLSVCPSDSHTQIAISICHEKSRDRDLGRLQSELWRCNTTTQIAISICHEKNNRRDRDLDLPRKET